MYSIVKPCFELPLTEECETKHCTVQVKLKIQRVIRVTIEKKTEVYHIDKL